MIRWAEEEEDLESLYSMCDEYGQQNEYSDERIVRLRDYVLFNVHNTIVLEVLGKIVGACVGSEFVGDTEGASLFVSLWYVKPQWRVRTKDFLSSIERLTRERYRNIIISSQKKVSCVSEREKRKREGVGRFLEINGYKAMQTDYIKELS